MTAVFQLFRSIPGGLDKQTLRTEENKYLSAKYFSLQDSCCQETVNISEFVLGLGSIENMDFFEKPFKVLIKYAPVAVSRHVIEFGERLTFLYHEENNSSHNIERLGSKCA